MSTLTYGYRPLATTAWHGLGTQLGSMLDGWQQRARQRRQLAELSDHQLNDIGISREQAEQEAAKPFWLI